MDLLNYMFSYLDKNNQLADKFSIDTLKNAEDKLFYNNVNLINGKKEFKM